MPKVVLIRHGESEWNKENRFTGWCDVDLSPQGEREARDAGQLLALRGYRFDCAYTSRLTRAIRTLHIVLRSLELLWIPEYKEWRLNERHYGGLQGYNKAEKAKEVGEEQVHIWRRSYDVPPPSLAPESPWHAQRDLRYRDLKPVEVPSTESLKDTVARVIPLWNNDIMPRIDRGARVLIAAHGNSLRALVKEIKKISDDDIINLNIPTGRPLVIELNDAGEYRDDYYLTL